MTTNTVDTGKLRSIVVSMPKAKALFEYLTSRKRGRQDTSFRRITRMLREQKGVSFSQQELVQIFSGLQEAGAGRIVFSRNRPARFVWDFHLDSVANAALGSSAEIRRSPKPRVVLPRIEAAASAPTQVKEAPVLQGLTTSLPAGTGRVITIKRPGYEVNLPLDLTPAQARIASQLLSDLEVKSA